MKRKLRRISSILFRSCNLFFCWKPKPSQNNGEKLRSAASQYFLFDQPTAVRASVKILALIIWPFNAVRLVLLWNFRFAATVKKENGVGFLRQFVEPMRLAWSEFIHPRYYYLFRLFDKERLDRRGEYFLQRNTSGLFHALNAFESGDLINDKSRFADFCCKKDIPTPITFALFENGTTILKEKQEVWQETDVVVKPIAGHMGRGIHFGYAEGGGRYKYRGKSLHVKELFKLLSEESHAESLLLQKRLHNHPDLRRLSNEYLVTIRMVTYMDSDTPHFLGALLRLPYDEITISNHGWILPLDAETGRILSTPILPLLPEIKEKYIKAGELSIGNVIPFWKESKKLVLKTHRLLPEYFSLGWDVAIGEDGPFILEANINWGIENLQLFHDCPLGNTEFANCAVEKLNLLNESAKRPRS